MEIKKTLAIGVYEEDKLIAIYYSNGARECFYATTKMNMDEVEQLLQGKELSIKEK